MSEDTKEYVGFLKWELGRIGIIDIGLSEENCMRLLMLKVTSDNYYGKPGQPSELVFEKNTCEYYNEFANYLEFNSEYRRAYDYRIEHKIRLFRLTKKNYCNILLWERGAEYAINYDKKYSYKEAEDIVYKYFVTEFCDMRCSAKDKDSFCSGFMSSLGERDLITDSKTAMQYVLERPEIEEADCGDEGFKIRIPQLYFKGGVRKHVKELIRKFKKDVEDTLYIPIQRG